MQDVYGNEYLLITRDEYNRLLDEIDRLRKTEEEDRRFLCDVVQKQTNIAGDVISALIQANKIKED